MKAVIQRVFRGSVTVDGNIIGAIERGLVVLIGIGANDTSTDSEYILRKVLNMRLFPNAEGRPWDLSVQDIDGGILFVSQFTLMGYLKGNRPDYHKAMPPAEAEVFYKSFVEDAKKKYKAERIADGVFGAMMHVDIQNDGPVTILLDSTTKE